MQSGVLWFKGNYATILYSLHISVSVLIALSCKEKMVWWRARDVLIYEYSSKSLGIFLKLYSLVP